MGGLGEVGWQGRVARSSGVEAAGGSLPVAGQSSSSLWLQTADAVRMSGVGVEGASWTRTLLQGHMRGERRFGSTPHTSGTSFGGRGRGGRKRTGPSQRAFRSRIRMRMPWMAAVVTGWGSRTLKSRRQIWFSTLPPQFSLLCWLAINALAFFRLDRLESSSSPPPLLPVSAMLAMLGASNLEQQGSIAYDWDMVTVVVDVSAPASITGGGSDPR